MFESTVTILAETGLQRAQSMQRNPVGFWLSCMMAGIYIGFGILLIFSLGSLVDPSVRPLVMGGSFGLALILVVFAGSDLFTGLTMFMTLAVLERRARPGELAGVWVTSWFGNLAGSLLLGGLFVLGGGGLITGASSGLIYKVAAAKMDAGPLALVCRAMLCNWLVCLALWMAARIASESGRMIAIAWCLFAFIASGYEHSIANMTIFAVALFSTHPAEVTWVGAAYNLFWVTFGNVVAGALFMGAAYWIAADRLVASADRIQAQPAE